VRPRRPAVVSGARIDVVGSIWARTIAADAAGVYELDGLPPGDYTLRLPVPQGQTVGFFPDEGSTARIRLDEGGLVERNFQLLWDGRIEGKVLDASGAPARAWVQLLRADGQQVPGFVHHFEQTAADGAYRFDKIPRGRYLVVVNPGGPGDEWPHDIQYHPGTDRKEQAHVFDVADGERISGVDFRVPLLAMRTLRARVVRADGTPVQDASVCVAYDKADDFDALAGLHCTPGTDESGGVVIRTYGTSQVRIFAQRFVFDGDEPGNGRYVSRPLQDAADRIPNEATFVLNPQPARERRGGPPAAGGRRSSD
jgi:hypothetical protein